MRPIRAIAPSFKTGARLPAAASHHHHPAVVRLSSSAITTASNLQRNCNCNRRTFYSTPHSQFHSAHRTMASATSFYDFTPSDKKGNQYPLSNLKGKVVLVVNTASKCGFTPQFGGLEALYKELKAAHPNDFEIVGFPCNQFGGQDPGSNDEIQSFCQVNYGVSFPVLGKVDVNGANADPVWEWMKKEKPGLMGLKMIKWNFEKFLIGKDGAVKARWASTTKPEGLKAAIEKELTEGKA